MAEETKTSEETKSPEEEVVPVVEKVEEAGEDVGGEEEKGLPFPNATIVREIKRHVAPEKMIRKEVKIGMNKFLGEVVEDVSKSMDKNPYAMIDYRMFEEAVRPFKKVKELDAEKKRLIAHLDAIIEDCLSIKRDLEEKFGTGTE